MAAAAAKRGRRLQTRWRWIEWRAWTLAARHFLSNPAAATAAAAAASELLSTIVFISAAPGSAECERPDNLLLEPVWRI